MCDTKIAIETNCYCFKTPVWFGICCLGLAMVIYCDNELLLATSSQFSDFGHFDHEDIIKQRQDPILRDFFAKSLCITSGNINVT